MPSDKERWDKLQKQKDDIVDSIRKTENYEKLLSKVDITYVDNPMEKRKEETKRIKTGTALDRVLSRKGGIEKGRSVELYGVFASGKTQVVQALAAEAEGLIIYIDSEHTFSPDRFAEICEARGKNPEEVGERLRWYKPNDWIEQEATIRQLPEFNSDGKYLEVGIVIVDSIMKFWAETRQFYGRENLTQRQQLVRAQLADLASYARRHNAVLVITNQVYVEPVDNRMKSVEQIYKSRGGATLEHFADYRILLRKGPRNIRFARVVDSIDLPLLEVPFVLEESGIMDLADPGERVKAMEAGEKYGTRFLTSQLQNVSAGKKYYIRALELGMISADEAAGFGLSEKEIKKALDEQAKTVSDRTVEQVELKLTPEEMEALGIEDDTIPDDTEDLQPVQNDGV